MTLLRYVSIVLSVFCLYNCQSVDPSAMKTKGKALGKMGEIVVVSDNSVWDGMVGDSIDYYLAGPFPITPRPEPLFDLRHFTPEKVEYESLLQELRTYLIVADLSDENSPSTQMLRKDLGDARFEKAKTDPNFNSSIGKNKWATGQIIMYLFGNGHEEICKSIRANLNSITHRVHDHDNEQLHQFAFSRGVNLGLTDTLGRKYGIELKIPIGYREVPVAGDSILWLRSDVDDAVVSSLVFRKVPYKSKSQLTKQYFISLRDQYGKAYVDADTEGSYMQVNDKDMPILEYNIELDGAYAKEFRGIWEMTKDFMGGPFTGYLILNEKKGEVIFVDGWVYAPGEDKRKFVRQLEHIVKSIKMF